jgi:hypothetical protein
MSTDVEAQRTQSLPGRLLSRSRSPWITAGIGLVLILIPLGAAQLSGVLVELIRSGHVRQILLPSAIILYILSVSPIMDRMQDGVIRAFRPLVRVDDEAFVRLVAEASRISPIGEAAAFGTGAVFGLWLGVSAFAEEGLLLLRLCLYALFSLMVGMLVWTIYGAIAGTRLTTELQRQPLQIDIFDIEPFEPIGRLSLAMALVILGGVVLAMVLGLAPDTLYDWRNWVMYVILALVSVLLFFLSMRDTHRVLAAAKKRELDAVQGQILRSCRALLERLDAGEEAGSLSAEINALVAYEKRVEATGTWPYNVAMLRTLFVSVIIPAGAAGMRAIFEVMAE